MISATIDDLEPRALELAKELQDLPGLDAEILQDTSEIGGGSVPAQQLPTWVVAVKHESLSLNHLSDQLRENHPCIFTRIQRDRVLLDTRTLRTGDMEDLVEAFSRITPRT